MTTFWVRGEDRMESEARLRAIDQLGESLNNLSKTRYVSLCGGTASHPSANPSLNANPRHRNPIRRGTEWSSRSGTDTWIWSYRSMPARQRYPSTTSKTLFGSLLHYMPSRVLCDVRY
eukprot:304231-Rhodomonas_salina.2